jgi:hypothetical protein
MTTYKKNIKKRYNLTLKNNKQYGGAARVPRQRQRQQSSRGIGYNESQKKTNLDTQIIGIPIIEYLSQASYEGNTNYSDHSPILYEINEYIIIITWNVANFGNIQVGQTFNHKFNLARTETLSEYVHRLVNIVYALKKLIDTNKTRKESRGPMIFCQELPQLYHGKISGGQQSEESEYQETLIKLFNNLLKSNGLTLIGDENTECNVIVDSEDVHTGIDKLVFVPEDDINPPNGQFKNLAPRYNYFYKIFKNNFIFYVNVHMQFDANFNTQINNCILLIKNYIENLSQVPGQVPGKLLMIYFIGDFNRSLNYQDIQLVNLYHQTPNTNFVQLQDGAKIGPGFKIYSTLNDQSNSLSDNNGGLNNFNVDYILQIIF